MRGGLSDLPGYWSDDLGLLQIVFGDDEVGLRLQDGGLGLLRARLCVVALELGDAARISLLHAFPVALRAAGFGLGGLEIRLALVHDRLVAFGVDFVEDVAGLDGIALLELDLLHVAVDLRQKIDLLHRLGMGHVALGKIVDARLNVRHGDGNGRLLHHRGHRFGGAAARHLQPHATRDPSAYGAGRNEYDRSKHRAENGSGTLFLLVFRHGHIPPLGGKGKYTKKNLKVSKFSS